MADPRTRTWLLELSELAARAADELTEAITRAGSMVGTCLTGGGQVLACGNGGSAADAQHFVAELVGRMCHERRPLPAIALSSDPSIVTCIGNDYGYENLFARQVGAHGRAGDVLIGISTSGRSRNVILAMEEARRRGVKTIALLGAGGDPSFEECDVVLHMPTGDTQRIQELHMAMLHAICALAEEQVVAADADGAA